MLSGLLIIGGLALVFGLMLGYASVRFRVEGNPLIEEVDKILPQIQCGQCGYPGCKPYATALVEKDDAINKCPPGGEETMLALAELLHKDPQPLAAQEQAFETGLVAFIREEECIGCVRCIKACPVDAILGATKFMHTVIAQECTGCHLCVPECPVDCIDMIKPPVSPQSWQWQKPATLEDIPVIEVKG